MAGLRGPHLLLPSSELIRVKVERPKQKKFAIVEQLVTALLGLAYLAHASRFAVRA
jgi:hypothetical protein